jgi:hypothetical protein
VWPALEIGISYVFSIGEKSSAGIAEVHVYNNCMLFAGLA